MSSMNINEKNIFKEVYPFATEAVATYLKELNLEDKTILTVGSSLDQAFNSLILGAKDITVFDININTEEFYQIKKDLILKKPRKKIYKEVLNLKNIPLSKDVLNKDIVTKTNLYLKNDENYNLLREKLIDTNITFINGDIFNLNNSLENKSYDKIILSNVLQYLECCFDETNVEKGLKTCFDNLNKHLNDNGLIQLLYLYCFSKNNIKNNECSNIIYDIERVYNVLNSHNLDIHFFDGVCTKRNTDAIVTYTKKR